MSNEVKTAAELGALRVSVENVQKSVEKIEVTLDHMSDTLQENTKQLEIHIEGVKLAREAAVRQDELIKNASDKRFAEVDENIEKLDVKIKKVNQNLVPIYQHMAHMKLIGKALGVLLSPAAIYYAVMILKTLKVIH